MANPTFALIPSVAVSNGKATVPGTPGVDAGSTTVTPLAAAQHWYNQGAQRIQVIDVDAAKGGTPNTHAITQLVHGVRHQLRTDLVSGVHDQAGLDAALHLGPAQIVLSTAAMADWDFLTKAVAEHGAKLSLRLVIGEGGVVHAPGTTVDGAIIGQWLPALEGIGMAHYLVCDAGGEGHFWRRHSTALQEFCQATHRPVTAGAGVESLENLHQLIELLPGRLDGAVIGHALDTQAFSFAEAQTAIEARYDPYEWGPARP